MGKLDVVKAAMGDWDHEGIKIVDYRDNPVVQTVGEAKTLLASQHRGMRVALVVKVDKRHFATFAVAVDESGSAFNAYASTKQPFPWDRMEEVINGRTYNAAQYSKRIH